MKTRGSGKPSDLSNELWTDVPVSDWPAKKLMQFAHDFLQEVENKDIDYLDEHYSLKLAEYLCKIWPTTKVFWSPAREKSKEVELKREAIELNRIRTAEEFLNFLIIDLNKSYHSIPFLHQFIDYTYTGNANIFKIWPDDKGINFRIDSAAILSWHFQSKSGGSLNQFKEKFVSKYSQSFEYQLDNAKLDIVNYLNNWDDFEPNVINALHGYWGDQPPFTDIMAESKRAMQHFALMSLFIITNKLSAASYFISKTSNSKHDSSMVVYWPSMESIPDETIHYLLKMLFGLNAFPILNAIENAESRDRLMMHFGHTMGHRIAPLQQFFEGKEDYRESAKQSAYLLSDSMILLQLSGIDSLEDLLDLPKEKRKRFIVTEESHSKPLNISDKLKGEWRNIVDAQEIGKDQSGMRRVCSVQLVFNGDADKAQIEYITAPHNLSFKFRLHESVYRELFLELLLNIAKYSQSSDTGKNENIASIDVLLEWTKLNDYPVIIISNIVGDKEPPRYLTSNEWVIWPKDNLHDGPGMAISVLRRLNMGEMFYSYEQGVFKVAVYLKGFSDLK